MLGYLQIGRGVAYARGGAHDNGRMVALRDLECLLHHRVALLQVLRIEYGDLGERGKTARILLGLGGDGAGIIGDKQHQTALDAYIVKAHERV